MFFFPIMQTITDIIPLIGKSFYFYRQYHPFLAEMQVLS